MLPRVGRLLILIYCLNWAVWTVFAALALARRFPNPKVAVFCAFFLMIHTFLVVLLHLFRHSLQDDRLFILLFRFKVTASPEALRLRRLKELNEWSDTQQKAKDELLKESISNTKDKVSTFSPAILGDSRKAFSETSNSHMV